MIKTLNIDGRSIDISTSTRWLYIYRNQFGRDILPELMPAIDAILRTIGDLLDGSGALDELKDLKRGAKMSSAVTDAIIEILINIANMETVVVLNILWALAYNANENIGSPLEFYKDKEVKFDEVVPELAVTVIESSVSSKNARSLLAMLRPENRSTSTPSPSQESTEG